MIVNLETKIERDGNITKIIKPGHVFTVAYSHHEIPQNFEQINTEAIFLELVNPNQYASPDALIERCKKHKQYSNIPLEIQNKKIALCFPDISLNSVDDTIAKLNSISMNKFVQVNYSLQFLRDDISYLLEKQYNSSLSKDEKDELNSKLTLFGTIYLDMAYKVAPEIATLLFNLRDLLISHKMEWFAESFNVNPCLLIGVFHLGIEHYLQYSSNERIDELRKIHPIINKEIDAGNLVPDSVYKMSSYISDGNCWDCKTYEIHELKELVVK